jgi:hypothetical protein
MLVHNAMSSLYNGGFIMMKHKGFLTGIFSVLLVFGLAFIGCDGGGGGGGGGVDRNLVAKWYLTQADADNETNFHFEIASDGSVTGTGVVQEVKVTASAGKISVTTINGQAVDGAGEANYVVSGTTLKFSNASLFFLSWLTVQNAREGKYYKKAGSNGGGGGNGKVAAPTASVAGGRVGSGTQVMLSSGTTGADIYYTINNSTPTTSSTQYTGPIPITANTTIKAIAAKHEMDNSTVLAVSYTIDTSMVATPTANEPGGAIASGAQIELSTDTSGATIYYTINGNTPTVSSTRYTGPISITADTTIKAIAVKSGMSNSTVLTVSYSMAYVMGYAIMDLTWSQMKNIISDEGWNISYVSGTKSGYATGNSAENMFSNGQYVFDRYVVDHGDEVGSFEELLNLSNDGISAPEALKTALKSRKASAPLVAIFAVPMDSHEVVLACIIDQMEMGY